MTPSRITLLSGSLLASLLLSACSESSVGDSTEASIAQQATFAFSNTCLASLPDFESFQSNARKASLRPSADSGNIRSVYLVPNSPVFVGLMDLPGASDVEVCGLRVKSSKLPSSFGTEILKAARSATGSGSEEQFSSARFEYAIQLSNGSLLTHDVKESRDTYSNVFLITQPVPRERVPSLLSDE